MQRVLVGCAPETALAEITARLDVVSQQQQLRWRRWGWE